ncbi:MAG: hypothetical protein PHQ98_04865 [Candidatus ainarchaeum sp.]|nr:hypothetical protein [Candidatus ainarchaeum sp.]
MTKSDDRRKSFKFVKTSTKTKKEFFKKDSDKKRCAIENVVLNGVEHASKNIKSSKTQRRPSVPFGGVLSSKAREAVFVELAKVEAKVKQMDDVDIKYRRYVKQVEKRVE